MTKSEIANILADKQSHLSPKLVEAAVKEIFNTISNAILNGERVEIRGFGSFSLRYRLARGARNPKTGISLTTTNKYAVNFKPGKELKAKVNND